MHGSAPRRTRGWVLASRRSSLPASAIWRTIDTKVYECLQPGMAIALRSRLPSNGAGRRTPEYLAHTGPRSKISTLQEFDHETSLSILAPKYPRPVVRGYGARAWGCLDRADPCARRRSNHTAADPAWPSGRAARYPARRAPWRTAWRLQSWPGARSGASCPRRAPPRRA